MRWLGVTPSFSRPRVSDDYAFSEALIRTLKHRPSFPRRPFMAWYRPLWPRSEPHPGGAGGEAPRLNPSTRQLPRRSPVRV
ncbi:hypothetical protein D7X30_38565 [Corallococcus sp. AB011P]|nr:hypothetical protein D7X30_38565 [Corallococcus sp. AB011P]